MQKKKYRRINYRINHCSSQDAQYPVSQLLLQSPNAKGWQSKRFCQYPQAIIIQLVQASVLKQISVLSHQSKISTKIIIHSKLDENREWDRLGYISLQSNVNTNFQSRQLKTVNIRDTHALLLRFTVQANYVNNHNLFNQVGIISLCVFGQRIGGQLEQKVVKKIQGGDLDKNTLTKLKSLELQKRVAVEQEDYDRAQTIKKQIQRIKNLGNTLMLLEQKKRKAVENQNYQDAKIINQKIKKLRDAQGGGPNFSTRPSGTPSDYYRQRKPQQYQQQYQYQEEQHAISPITNLNKKKPQPMLSKKSPPRKQSFEEDRPIQVKNQNPYQNFQDDSRPTQKNDDQPASLSKQIYNECNPYFPIFDQDIFMHLFSTNHAHRQKGLNYVRQQIMGMKGNRNHIIEAFFYVIKKMIDDKNASVLLNVLDLFGIGMRKLKPDPISSLMSQVEYILQKMNDYLGHTNEKIRKLTQDIYVSLPTHKLTSKDTCYKALIVSSKREKPPKILTGRLKCITQIVKNYQLGRNYEDIVSFATKYVDDKNGDVRNSAISLICAISNQIGYSAIQPFLKNVRPKIIQTIEERIEQKGGNDDRNYDQKPIRNKPTQNKNKKKQMQYGQMENQNQFIEVPNKKIQNPQYTCDFCERFDKKFQNQNYRDLHLYNACPMLLICDQCKQAIQISQYTYHLLSQCKNSKYYKKCPRCKEAIHQRNYKSHTQKKQCIPAQPLAAANRCPLCHLDIPPGKQGWLTHLAKEGCDNNPRK